MKIPAMQFTSHKTIWPREVDFRQMSGRLNGADGRSISVNFSAATADKKRYALPSRGGGFIAESLRFAEHFFKREMK